MTGAYPSGGELFEDIYQRSTLFGLVVIDEEIFHSLRPVL
jgi:hypothetical protein